MASSLAQRNSGGRRQPIAISAGLVGLAAIVLACAAFVAVPLWTALVRDWQVEVISDPCEVKDATAGQDCFERRGLGESRHPAKGANAPIRLRPLEQKID